MFRVEFFSAQRESYSICGLDLIIVSDVFRGSSRKAPKGICRFSR